MFFFFSGVGVGGGSRGSRGVGGKGDKNNDPMKVDWEFGDPEDMATDKWERGPWRWISSPPMPTKVSCIIFIFTCQNERTFLPIYVER